jgi:hypothetical protein
MSGPQNAETQPLNTTSNASNAESIRVSGSTDDGHTERPAGKYWVAVSTDHYDGRSTCLVYRNGLLLTQAHGRTHAAALVEARRNVRNARPF